MDTPLRILAKCSEFEGSQITRLRLRALVLLLRYSGLRIGDAVTLGRRRICNGTLFLYTSKAGTPVYCPLPNVVIQALAALPSNGLYYFWTGQSKPKTAISHWQCELKRLFELAEVENGHAHRLRDSFAVALLLAGKPMEQLSMLLGHSSIRMTEKHYAPWIKARQEQLEAAVRDSGATDSVASLATKGTFEIHGEAGRVM